MKRQRNLKILGYLILGGLGFVAMFTLPVTLVTYPGEGSGIALHPAAWFCMLACLVFIWRAFRVQQMYELAVEKRNNRKAFEDANAKRNRANMIAMLKKEDRK